MKSRIWAVRATCLNFVALLVGCQSTQGQSPLAMTNPPGTIGRKPMGNPLIRAQAPDASVPGADLRIPSTDSQVVRSYYAGPTPTSNSAGASDRPSGGNFLRDLISSTTKLAPSHTGQAIATANSSVIPERDRKGPMPSMVVQASAFQSQPASQGSGLAVDPALLVNRAMTAYQKMDGVIVRFNRRERINGSEHPEETILLALRRDVFAVHMKWLGEAGGGRAVVYNPKVDDKKMTIVTAAGDIPFLSGGKRMSMDINSPLTRSSTRYSITDTGFLSMINRMASSVEAVNRGTYAGGSVTALGPVRRPEFPGEVDAVEVKIPAGAEKEFPGGGKRLMCFSKGNNLPVLLITWDEKGQEMEYMKYDRFQFLHLDDEDFDPEFLFSSGAKVKTVGSK